MTEDEAFENGPLSPSVMVGDGTMAYPLSPTDARFVKVADTAKETTLGKPRPMREEAVAAVPGSSGLLDAGRRPADGCVRE